jgi:hypothetical protein
LIGGDSPMGRWLAGAVLCYAWMGSPTGPFPAWERGGCGRWPVRAHMEGVFGAARAQAMALVKHVLVPKPWPVRAHRGVCGRRKSARLDRGRRRRPPQGR